MPAFRIDTSSGIVLFQGDGALEYRDWEAAVQGAVEQSGGRVRRVLSDRRLLQGGYSRWLIESAIEYIHGHADRFEAARWALLMRDDPAAHAARNVAQALADLNLRVGVFTDLEEALGWLLGVADRQELDRLTSWVNSK
jgi:hypothetical protein